jgi:hypothetical protein
MRMGCFCHASAAQLALQLPNLNIAAEVSLPGANVAMALSAFLSARGLPAAPWQPDPAWLDVKLPMPQLSASAIATISALVQMRAQVLAQFNLDLLVPAQVNALARIVTTMNAHLSAALSAALSASLSLSAPLSVNPTGWAALATLNAAIDQVQLALKAGLLAPSPSLMLSLTTPGGIPIGQWGALLRPLRMLAPLIAASLQLNASVSETAQLAAALKVLARISLPPVAAPELVANVTAALSAVASLQASLGIAPLQIGLPAVRLQIQAKLGALLATLSAQFGLKLTAALQLTGPSLAAALQSLVAQLMGMLPKLPVAAGNLATQETVQLALQAQALASINWQVPTNLPAIPVALATCTLAAQMQASLGIRAVLPSPCGSGCDAAALMRAASAAI